MPASKSYLILIYFITFIIFLKSLICNIEKKEKEIAQLFISIPSSDQKNKISDHRFQSKFDIVTIFQGLFF